MAPKLKIRWRKLQVFFSRRRNIFRVLFFGYLFGLLVFSMMGDRGLLVSLRLWTETKKINREIHWLENENRRLRHDIELYRHDLRTIETYAREELDLAGPNEIHYIFQ